jgi:hypothetical protein
LPHILDSMCTQHQGRKLQKMLRQNPTYGILILNLRAYVTFIVDLFRTYRPPSLTSLAMDITWVPVQLATNLHRSSEQPGVEPVPFYYISPSKKPL